MTEKTQGVWYFTFGCDHPLKKHAQPVKAPSYNAARFKMLDIYGDKWSSQHSEAGIRKYEGKYGPLQLLPEMKTTEEEAADIAERMGVAR